MRELTSQNEKNPTNPKKKNPQTKHTPAWASVAIRNVIVNDHSLVPNRGRRRSATVNSCPAATENIMTISLLFLLPVEQQKSRVEDYLDLEVLSTPPHFYAQFLKRSAPFPCPPPPQGSALSQALPAWDIHSFNFSQLMQQCCPPALPCLGSDFGKNAFNIINSVRWLQNCSQALCWSEVPAWRSCTNWINLYLKHFFVR